MRKSGVRGPKAAAPSAVNRLQLCPPPPHAAFLAELAPGTERTGHLGGTGRVRVFKDDGRTPKNGRCMLAGIQAHGHIRRHRHRYWHR